jgi:hypothetical protein
MSRKPYVTKLQGWARGNKEQEHSLINKREPSFTIEHQKSNVIDLPESRIEAKSIWRPEMAL